MLHLEFTEPHSISGKKTKTTKVNRYEQSFLEIVEIQSPIGDLVDNPLIFDRKSVLKRSDFFSIISKNTHSGE